MYKAAGDNVAFLDRTASHSTKGSRSGKVTVLPPEAVTEEVQYNDVRSQRDALREQLTKVSRQLGRLKCQAALATPGTSEHKKLTGDRLRLLENFNAVADALKSMNALARSMGSKSYCEVFYTLAKQMMDIKAFDALDIATAQCLGRLRTPDGTPGRAPGHKTYERLGLAVPEKRVAAKSRAKKPVTVLVKTSRSKPHPRPGSEGDLIAGAWDD